MKTSPFKIVDVDGNAIFKNSREGGAFGQLLGLYRAKESSRSSFMLWTGNAALLCAGVVALSGWTDASGSMAMTAVDLAAGFSLFKAFDGWRSLGKAKAAMVEVMDKIRTPALAITQRIGESLAEGEDISSELGEALKALAMRQLETKND
jgi:hypothetical protein